MSRRARPIRLPLALTVLLLPAGLLATRSAHAQYATSIPYAPYSSPYQSFSYPTVVNPGLPNQARLSAGPALGGGVSLDTGPDLLSLDPYGTFNRPTGGRYTPYYSVYRTPDRFNSSYVQRDQDYASNLARRDQIFYLMRAEQDPKRRLELAKELESVNAALRNAGSTARRPQTPRPTAPGTGANTAAPTASRRTSRGTPVAVPSFPAGATPRPTGPAALPPVTPPVATPIPDATTNPNRSAPASSIDPLEVLNRSRRIGPAGTSASTLPPGSASPTEAFLNSPRTAPSRVAIPRSTTPRPEPAPAEPESDPAPSEPDTPR